MKKIFTVLILTILILTCICFSGCGSKASEPEETGPEIIKFGKYIQTSTDIAIDIEWIVLEKDGNKALILSRYILDTMKYDDSSSIYANSYIREWLNDTFYNAAFTEEEKSKILTTSVDNSVASTGAESNPYATVNTEDKIFLLSQKEATEYFPTENERKASGTVKAKQRGLYEYLGYSSWWLRSPHSERASYARIINYAGRNDTSKPVSESTQAGARPACWVEL